MKKIYKSLLLFTTLALALGTIFGPLGQLLKAQATAYTTAALPDLYLEDLRWDVQNPVVGDNVSFSAKIKNIGTTATGLYNIKWRIEKEGYSQYSEPTGNGYASIAAGQYATSYNNNWLPLGGFIVTNDPTTNVPNAQGAGTYLITVTLDYDSQIAELNENNNSKTISIEVANTNPFQLSVEGINENYTTQEVITPTIKGTENNGTPATPEEGFNVQVYVFKHDQMYNTSSGQTVFGGNATYANGYWVINPLGPFGTGIYRLQVSLYCGQTNSYCSQTYGNAQQVDQYFWFNVNQANTAKHEIAYWWGKVNQHKENGVWMTDPDGVSGANIDKYQYCKKWYPSTQYAIYDDREYITGWKNAGNVGNFSSEANTYHCTELNVTADYEIQKTLFKNNQVGTVYVGGEPLTVKGVASSGWSDYTTCGDTRIRFEIDGSYITRYLCLNESDSFTYDNERVKVTLKNVIHGANQIYAVAEITKSEVAATPLPDLVVEDIEYYTDFSGNPNIYHENVITAKLCNEGDGALGWNTNLHTKFTINGQEADHIIDGLMLKPGQCTDMYGYPMITLPVAQFFPNITQSGNYEVTAAVDITNAVKEANENNNESTENVYIDLGELAQPPAIAQTGQGQTPSVTYLLNDQSTADSQDKIHRVYQQKQTSKSQKIIQRVKGRILLKVQGKGEAYYVSPDSNKVYYLKDGQTAYQVMKNAGQGISEVDFATLMGNDNKSKKLRQRLAGKIVLRVQSKGEAYYINPVNLQVTYLPDGNAAYNLMKQQGLGISNNDLNEIIGSN